jgi:hypothetical protein
MNIATVKSIGTYTGSKNGLKTLVFNLRNFKAPYTDDRCSETTYDGLERKYTALLENDTFISKVTNAVYTSTPKTAHVC